MVDEQSQDQSQAAPVPVELTESQSRIKGIYAELEQKGLDPANRPRGVPEGERDPHKTVRDLEDITGNPGHRGVNPHAPTWKMYPDGEPQTAAPSEAPPETASNLQYISVADIRAGRPIPQGWVIDTTGQYYVPPAV